MYELSFRSTAKAAALREELRRDAGAVSPPQPQGADPGNAANRTAGGGQRPAAKRPTARTGKARTHKPTAEQDEAIDLFRTGRNLRINAYAGTGKTSTLEMLSHSTSRRGQYLAFNRDIVADARKRFPDTVNCATTHSLAFRSVASRYGGNTAKLTGKMNANQLAELFQLKSMRLGEKHVLKPRSLGFLILDTVRRFTMSGDAEPLPSHVPLHGSLVAAPGAVREEAENFAVQGARMLWKRMCDSGDSVPLGHDGYLKLWALSEPAIAADFILLDEAQDTNPAVLELLKRQHCQTVYVGDKYQQIYEWRGAINAMDTVQTDADTYLTTSFRFGPRIAEAATKLLQQMGETRPLTGNSALASRIGVTPNARTILSRTNASTINTVITALDADLRPHLVGGTDELMRMLDGVADLKQGEPSTVAEFFGFTRWDEVVDFANSDDGEHLQTFVNLVQTRGERQLMWALRRTTTDSDDCDLIVSTAHRAKGREWPTVALTDDFLKSWQKSLSDPRKQERDRDPYAEIRLLYVALTRARESIEIPEPILRRIGMLEWSAPERSNPQNAPSGASSDGTARVDSPPIRSSPASRYGPTPPSAHSLSRNNAVPRPSIVPKTENGVSGPHSAPSAPSPASAAPTTPRPKGLLRRLLGF
ncbi:UvrD-helicase domain-containing protein [Elioraea rosea]|uniref:UvrD-helicase domain-containing protein n=1 Tax=Elioraea rosea TaxID=2492390 RepID=UPI0013152551|nr:UvrD-helicase domain-containing protein [Elioraea rosea]